jgi:hypothetical protein
LLLPARHAHLSSLSPRAGIFSKTFFAVPNFNGPIDTRAFLAGHLTTPLIFA